MNDLDNHEDGECKGNSKANQQVVQYSYKGSNYLNNKL